MAHRLIFGDCIAKMRALPANSIDAIVTDPPYGLGFMGKAWDDLPPSLPWARECLRVLKPGGHLLAFGGTRTWHRLAVAVEDAGFEMRDSIAWLYGSGFPKSLDVSKAIDKAAGATREVVGSKLGQPGYSLTNGNGDHRTYSRGLGNTGSGEAECAITAPATPDAERWQGWGTALKPAFEPIVVARKPLAGTVAGNVLAHGTGALNVDGCRVGVDLAREPDTGAAFYARREQDYPVGDDASTRAGIVTFDGAKGHDRGFKAAGRWPANVLLDGSQAEALDEQSGERKSAKPSITGRYGEHEDTGGNAILGRGLASSTPNTPPYGDTGGASRFFPTFRYQAKAPTRERPVVDGVAHPTVKPLELMRWLVRLVTPPGGTVLDPFAGSGTTGEAALLEGFDALLVERTVDYLPLIVSRYERNNAEIEVRER